MKRNIVTLSIVTLFVLATTAQVWAADPTKVGFFNMEDILNTSEAGKAANDELKKAYEQNKQKIQVQEKELYRLKEEMEKQRPVLTEKALKEKEENYNKKFRDYQDLVKDANDEMNVKRQELVSKFVPEILKVVEAIAKKEGYMAVFDLASVPVAFYNKDLDLTKRIIEEFNKVTTKK